MTTDEFRDYRRRIATAQANAVWSAVRSRMANRRLGRTNIPMTRTGADARSVFTPAETDLQKP